jgi:myosin-5
VTKGSTTTSTTRQTVLATLTVDDEEFAPPHLRGATVSLSYDNNDVETVCNANTWWIQEKGVSQPPQDLTSLTHLHEPSVVYCLLKHYERNSIYAYTGKILLALNPFQMLPKLYGDDVMKRYYDDETDENSLEHPRPPPHVYAVAQDAYRSLLYQGDNQSILVSGESGSGKTVTTKIIMGYLASQSQRTSSWSLSDSLDKANGQGVESQIMQSNPILESFGNARTVRNDNSSRFGKFMELLFTPSTGTLVSASIETYLLEKVRLISQAPGERNYHIFYELLQGLSQVERKELRIDNDTAKDFKMTACSGTFDRRDGVEDRETYQDLRMALDTVGFTESQQKDLFAVVCALLHTSNITFTTRAGEGSELGHSTSLKKALDLLGVTQEALNNALCLCAIQARGEVFHKKLSVAQADKAREAFIKATYGALFTHIVRSINNSITVHLESASRRDDLPRIGVLDIFGFESFDVNSFEQLCINYCNEALQQQFNKFVFKLEQREYEQEGIDWSFIEFPDNQDILDLIEKKRDGILSILDENCRLASCTDASFCRAMYEKCDNHSRFLANQTQKVNQTFTIDHYAGMVTYSASNFLEKNKDELPKETTELLTSSSVPFFAYLGELLKDTESAFVSRDASSINGLHPSFSDGVSSRNKTLRRGASSILRETVGSQFSVQLQELRERIDATTPHYVRCLKPNDDLVPNQFEPHIIAEQLRCAGVLEAIRVSRVGFPHRFYHEQFLERYGILAVLKTKSRKRGRDSCASLITALIPQVFALYTKQGIASDAGNTQKMVSLGMQVGFSKVFLRAKVFDALEMLRNAKLAQSAIIIQKHMRRSMAQLQYYDMYMATITIQCFFRMIGAHRRRRTFMEHSAAMRIQCAWRRFFAETELMAAKLIAHFCQAYRRGAIARRLYKSMTIEKQAITVQRFWRGRKVKKVYTRTLRSVITLQCCWRCYLALRIFKDRKREARSLGAVSAERDRFKEESLLLRREVERLRLAQEQEIDDKPYEEVDRLRREVERLQTILAQTQGSVSRAYSELEMNKRPSITKNNSWFDAGRGTVASKDTVDPSTPTSARSGIRSNQSYVKKSKPEQVTPTSTSFSPVASSPNVSLLDSAPEEAFVDYQLKSIADASSDRVIILDDGSVMKSSPLRQDTSTILHASLMSHSFLDEAEDDEHLHRMDQHLVNNETVRLHDAIRKDDIDLMNRIVANSNDPLVFVNNPDSNGRTALHVAIECCNANAARTLLEKGAVANAQDNIGDTPLHLAKGATMVKLLLEQGNANPNIPNIDGVCALHNYVQRLDVGSVRLLLNNRAHVDVADNTNWFIPLHLAMIPSDHIELLDEETIQRARIMIVDLLCGDRFDFDLNYQDHEGNTALHYAVQLKTPDATEIVSTLLEKGANPKMPNGRNQHPLLLLCHNDDLRQFDVFQECLHALLYYGADPNLQSNTGCTPLHLSLYHHDIDSAVQLVSSSAELHLLWRKPKSWIPHWDEMGTTDVLALDMVSDDHAIYRILSAIKKPRKWAPSRPWCMQCKTLFGSGSRAIHCGHCGRHVCGGCTRRTLPPECFPKSFDIFEPSWVCVVCEKILMDRKEDFFSNSSGSTHPISSIGDEEDQDVGQLYQF